VGYRVRNTVRSVHISRTRQSVLPCSSVDAWKRGPGQSSERTNSFDTSGSRHISDTHMLPLHNIQGMGRRFIKFSERLFSFSLLSSRTCLLIPV
jgi:hypothetical protein